MFLIMLWIVSSLHNYIPHPLESKHRIFPLAVWNTGTGRQPLCISKMLEKWLSDGCLLLTFSLEFNAIMAVGSAHGSPWHLLCCLRR